MSPLLLLRRKRGFSRNCAIWATQKSIFRSISSRLLPGFTRRKCGTLRIFIYVIQNSVNAVQIIETPFSVMILYYPTIHNNDCNHQPLLFNLRFFLHARHSTHCTTAEGTSPFTVYIEVVLAPQQLAHSFLDSGLRVGGIRPEAVKSQSPHPSNQRYT